MKKVILFSAVAAVALFMGSCNSTLTPDGDNTKLYPAGISQDFTKNIDEQLFGYINDKGEMKIAAIYDYASTFSCGYANVEKGELDTYIDKNGNLQMSPVSTDGWCNDFYYNVAKVSNGKSYGFINTKMEITAPTIFSSLGRMSENGLTWAKQNSSDDYYGFINKKGEFEIQPSYSDAYVFYDGVAAVKLGDKWGAIDKKGKLKIQPMYYALRPLGEGLLAYKDDSKDNYYGIMDTSGKIIKPKQFESIGAFNDNGLAPVGMDEKMGYINTKGDIKIACHYRYAQAFSDGYAFVTLDNDDYTVAMIDKTGSIKLQLGKGEYLYDADVLFPHNGLFLVVKQENGNRIFTYRDTKNSTIYTWTYKGSYDYDDYEYYDYYMPARRAAHLEDENIGHDIMYKTNFGLGKKH